MSVLILTIFIIAYLSISLESYIHINKGASALISAVLCWTIYIGYSHNKPRVLEQLNEQVGQVSGILFFLLSAMTVVELIDAYGGFDIITRRINMTSKRSLLWTISIIAFLLSPVLDNLTTCIVMVSLLRKLVHNPRERLLYVGMVIIAANTGGAWSPTGDVTTTMLWIGNQVSAKHLVLTLFLPSLACLLVPLAICSARMQGLVTRSKPAPGRAPGAELGWLQYGVLAAGIAVLLCVPFFRMVTGLPPFMGILLGLGMVWIMTEVIGRRHGTGEALSLVSALQRIDTPSILFFLGILLSVGALEATGMLREVAVWLDRTVGNERVIVTGIGMFSSVVDNVPLVAASQAMYSLERFPPDHEFWMLLAYTTGSGGSILLIGSAAGVAAMGMEKIDFMWYLKKMTPLALAGFFSGIVVYFLQQYLLGLV